MFKRILDVIPEGNRKIPLKYYRMMNTIMDHLTLSKNRYLLAHPIQTQGMELLRYFILNLPIAELEACSNDAERYSSILKEFKQSYLMAYDSVICGSIDGGRWFKNCKSSEDIPEIVLDISLDDPEHVYPFDKPWEDWQDIRSVRILYHDSLELPEDFAPSMWEFKKDIPSVAVIGIDVTTLCFKYYKYYQDCKGSQVSPDPNEFLKQYEYQYFFEDMYEIFTLNLLLKIFSDSELTVKDVVSSVVTSPRIVAENMLTQGITGIYDFVELLKTNACKLQDFVGIKWFLVGSILDKFEFLTKKCCVPDRQQYLWAEVSLNIPYFALLVAISKLYPDAPVAKTIAGRSSELYIKRFRTTPLPSIVHGAKLKKYVDDLRKTIETLLQT